MISIRDASAMLPPSAAARQSRGPNASGGPRARERGIALALALLGLTLIYLLAAGGFALAILDGRMSEAHRVSVEAFYAADGALQLHLGDSAVLRSPVEHYEPVGRITISAEPLLDLPGGDRLWRYTASARAGLPGREEAMRTVSRVALEAGATDLPAAFVSVSDLESAGTDVRIQGEDEADPPCSPEGAVAGLLGPTGVSVPSATVTGSPAVGERDMATEGIPGWRLAWPIPLADGTNVHRAPGEDVDGGEGLPADGQGLLVAAGDLELDGPFRWRGLILVGGVLRAANGVRIEGGVMTGLNTLAGESPSASVLGPGEVEIVRHSCHLAAALASLAGPVAVPGTWSEVF